MSKIPNANNDTDLRSDEDRPPSTPRWVKVSGIIAIGLVLLFLILKLTGIGGNHGPSRHTIGVEPVVQIEHASEGGY